MNFFPIDQYKKIYFLGSGAFGEVCHYSSRTTKHVKGGHAKGQSFLLCNCCNVAVKSTALPFRRIEKDSREWREVKIMERLSHKNVVQFLGICDLEGRIGLVMELCMGSLQGLIDSSRMLQTDKVGVLVYQITLGLSYLHKQHIIHRDIKPQNILIQCHAESSLSLVEVDCMVLKIADFGLSKELDAETSATMTVVGTLKYMAPEVKRFFNKKNVKAPKVHYSMRSDVYSLGLVTYELFRKNLNDISQQKKESGIAILEDSSLPSPLASFLSSCLQQEPRSRQTTKELRSHQFFDEDCRDRAESIIPPRLRPGKLRQVSQVHVAKQGFIILGISNGDVLISRMSQTTLELRKRHSRSIRSIASNNQSFAVGCAVTVSVWRNCDAHLVRILKVFYCFEMNMNNLHLVAVSNDSRISVFSALENWIKTDEIKLNAHCSGPQCSALTGDIFTVVDCKDIKQLKLGTEVAQEVYKMTLDDFLCSLTPDQDSTNTFWVGARNGCLIKVNLHEKTVIARYKISEGPRLSQIQCFGSFLICRLYHTKMKSSCIIALELKDLEFKDNSGEALSSSSSVPPRRVVANFYSISSNFVTNKRWIAYYAFNRLFMTISTSAVISLEQVTETFSTVSFNLDVSSREAGGATDKSIPSKQSEDSYGDKSLQLQSLSSSGSSKFPFSLKFNKKSSGEVDGSSRLPLVELPGCTFLPPF